MREKQQNQAQILGRKGERWFQSVLPASWAFVKPSDDFGFDGLVFVGKGSTLTGLAFAVQVKASRTWRTDNHQHIVLRVDTASLGQWATLLMPVLLILFDERRATAFYSWVYDLLPDSPLALVRSLRANASVTLRVPITKEITPDCWPQLAKDVESQVRWQAETLAHANLTGAVLPVVHTLLRAFKLPCLLEFYPASTRNAEPSAVEAAEVTAHQDVLSALKALRAKYAYQSATTQEIERLEKTYASGVTTFVKNIEARLGREKDKTLLAVNSQAMVAARSQMLSLLLETGLVLTTLRAGYEARNEQPGARPDEGASHEDGARPSDTSAPSEPEDCTA